MFGRFNFFKQYLILLTKNNKLQEQINELKDSNKKIAGTVGQVNNIVFSVWKDIIGN